MNEALYHIHHNGRFAQTQKPPQQTTLTSVTTTATAPDTLLCERHSHGSLPAFFSQTDDADAHPGHLPASFVKAVNMLMQPYIPITEKYYRCLLAQLEKAGCDFFILENGHLVTIGETTGGFAIMPLLLQEAHKVKEKYYDCSPD